MARCTFLQAVLCPQRLWMILLFQKRNLYLGHLKDIKNGSVPLCKHCGGIIKPKVVLYEEPLYDGIAEEAVRYISNADMLIVGGTSLAVYPAASFVDFFKGRYIVIINKSQTHLDSRADLVICDSIGDVLDFAVKELVI